MKTSWLAATITVLLLVLWMLSGIWRNDAGTDASESQTTEPMRVQVDVIELTEIVREIEVQGQLEPLQHLMLRSETSGRVQEVFAERGARVNADQPLLQLEQGGRISQLAEAEARVKSARSEQQAAQTLQRQRLQSALQLQQAEAQLEAAMAQLAGVKLDIEQTLISAPFDAVLNDRPVEPGSLVERGDMVAELVDDSAFKVTAYIAQQTVADLSVGQDASVQLITGQTLAGKISYLSSIADAQTRSFKLEALVTNPDREVAAGVSATMSIPVEAVMAAFVSPSTLSLGDAGELGIKQVDDNNLVQFQPIEIISTNLDGAWVTGLVDGMRIITLGQGFVNVGETVVPVAEPAGGQ